MQGLALSFRSKYDGYIYPSWKVKQPFTFFSFEDAVVVGEDYIVLGDGLGGAEGYSGIFSTHQCLKIAEELKKRNPKNSNDLANVIRDASIASVEELQLDRVEGKMSDVATTLVYTKLVKENLLSGVIGDSGFMIYHYDTNQRILKLIERSKEENYKYNTPYNISPNEDITVRAYENKVHEGDIVIVASDGLIDVLPSSFITAATNYLVRIMLEKHKSGVEFEKFDYDYDLADFVEGYVQNLNQVSKHLKSKIVKTEQEIKKEKEFLNKKMTQSEFYESLLTSKSVIDNKISLDDPKIEKKVFEFSTNANLLPPAEELSKGKTDQIMKDIYTYEICNIFDPTEDSLVFRKLENYRHHMFYGMKNYPHRKDIEILVKINCFNHNKTPKLTNHNGSPTKWDCKTIHELDYPIHPSLDANENHHDYKECVNNAIPKLPADTTAKAIAQAFNSRYFARNLALAVKFLAKDERVKADEFFMKRYYNEEAKKAVFTQKISPESYKWKAKEDDVGIAAAAVIKESIFESSKEKNSRLLNKSFGEHLNALTSVFTQMLQTVTERIIQYLL